MVLAGEGTCVAGSISLPPSSGLAKPEETLVIMDTKHDISISFVIIGQNAHLHPSPCYEGKVGAHVSVAG